METVDVYADNFEAVGNPYGMTLNFAMSVTRSQSYPIAPAEVARVRMSWEMAKVLSYILANLVKRTEGERGVSYPIANEVLNSLKIPKEDWDAFWHSSRPLI